MEEKNYWWVWIVVIICGGLLWWWIASNQVKISPETKQSGSYYCPSDKLIKGNAQSGIYHMPGGQYYNKTMAERCFATEDEAIEAGYRRSIR